MFLSSEIWFNPWIWLTVTLGGFGLCTFLPIGIKDDRTRNFVNRVVLIPVSLVLIIYAYPVGLELFRRLAIHF